jgi:ribonuclease HI
MSAELWFDGACEPRNPGGWIVAAFVLLIPGHDEITAASIVEPAPANTNNIAEWNALIAGLTRFREIDESDVLVIHGDSQLVIRQLNGEWACNKSHLLALRDKARELLSGGITWKAEWVRRDENEQADALGREAYEMATGETMPVRSRK